MATAARLKNGPAFVHRDQNVKTTAAERVASLADPEADQAAVGARARAERGNRLAPFDNRVRQFEDLTADADRSRARTEAEVDRSVIGTLLREDPRDVANRLLGGKHDSAKKLDEVNNMVRNDEAAKRGWKAAVSEVLIDRVASSRPVGDSYELQYARLAKEFKDNEALLASVYAPEEMNTLRQGHKLCCTSKVPNSALRSAATPWTR